MLQSIQNRAAKLVVGGFKYDHVSPILMELHWLPVNKRIVFKIGVLMFKCLNGLAPDYLSDNFLQSSSVMAPYEMRSGALNCLKVPAYKLKLGSRSFHISGPTIWNSFPCSLRQPGLTLSLFKAKLKTHLFN